MDKKGWMNVQNRTFPVNYFNSILTPVKNFMGRKQLSWPKIIFVILFLNGIMMIPIVLNYAQSEEFQLEATFPTIHELVDEEVVAELGKTTSSNGQVTFPEPFILEKDQGVVVGSSNEEDITAALEEENALLFAEDKYYLKEGDLPISEVVYTSDVNWDNLQTPEEVQDEINRQWYQYNRVFIVATYSFMITGILLIMNIFLIFGAAFFMALAGRSALIDISSYKESVNLILNAMGLPVLAALAFGLFIPDISMIMSLQTFGLVIILVLIYYKTQFSERFVERRKKEVAGIHPDDE